MDKNKTAAKHIENELRMAATHIGDELNNVAINITNEVYSMLYAREQAMLDEVLEIIDTAQTYKMYPGQEDTCIDKRVMREAVEALKRGAQG